MPKRSPVDREQSKKFESQIKKGRAKRQSIARKKKIIASWGLSKVELEGMLEQVLSQHAGHLVSTRIEQFSIVATDGQHDDEGVNGLAELQITATLSAEEQAEQSR
jgi:hypothetical protein